VAWRCCRGVGNSPPLQCDAIPTPGGVLSHLGDRALPTPMVMALLAPHPTVAGGGGARAPPLAVGSDPDGRNRSAPASPSLRCKCIFQVFQSFQRYVAVVSDGCNKSRSGDVAHVVYVASVLEVCCRRLFNIFHLFLDVCCNNFYLDVVYVFTHMLQ
jgi:hypothetical protein